MNSFLASLQQIKNQCVIQDALYWDVKKLFDGEIPIATECCSGRKLWLKTKDGFFIGLELLEVGSFEVMVRLPNNFHHEELNLGGILNVTRLSYSSSENEYYWNYYFWGDANLFLPLEKQHPDSFVSGPVQILDTCRAFIQELISKKHNGPCDTFKKNLRWMKRQTNCDLGVKYWGVELEDGESPISPCILNEKSLRLQTNEGFIINISMDNTYYSCHLKGTIELPLNFHITSWLLEHAKYDTLNCYLTNLDLEVYMKKENIYQWDHGNKQNDFNFAQSKDLQGEKRISGPVQVLEEARHIIRAVMMKESKLRMNKIREDLMMKACHPKRIALWEMAGFDPFKEDEVELYLSY